MKGRASALKLTLEPRSPGELWRRFAVGAMLVVSMGLIWEISKVERWDTMVWATLFFLCLDAREDEAVTSWLKFLPIGILLLAVPYYIYKHAADVWWKIADWQMNSVRHLWNWDLVFSRIPLNDPGWMRAEFPSTWLTNKLGWVYNFGFGFAIWGGTIRSFLTRDWRKMLHYLLATHLLQTPLIIPFYNTVELHEVWWVLGRPDVFNRPSFMNAYTVKLNAQNCFPSMHTSIAFAVMLLALREKGPIFKWAMTAYTAAIIFSTLYLDIHWTIDVLAGMAFAYGVVKLSDWIMSKLKRPAAAAPAARVAEG
jgi:membrane-associated phospholipid phosphatase